MCEGRDANLSWRGVAMHLFSKDGLSLGSMRPGQNLIRQATAPGRGGQVPHIELARRHFNDPTPRILVRGRRQSRLFNGHFNGVKPGSKLSDLRIRQGLCNHVHDFVLTFAAAVISQLLSHIKFLLPRQIRCIRECGHTANAMTQCANRFCFCAACCHVIGIAVTRGDYQANQKYILHGETNQVS